MFSPSRAKHVRAYPVRGGLRLISAVLLTPAAVIALAGCQPTTISLAGADPADPSARIAPIHDRSTTSPYVSLRPAAPDPWRERNDDVAPRARPSGQER
jgi:hypothetical protein